MKQAWRAVGAAQLARVRGRNDAKRWHRAAAAWDELERPIQAAIARWREVEAHIEAAIAGAAAPVGTGGEPAARQLGAGGSPGGGGAICSRLDWTSQRGGRAGRRDRPAGEDPFGLTARERQVLALVAQGATNRQIGAALFMAEKTASVHVSRILGSSASRRARRRRRWRTASTCPDRAPRCSLRRPRVRACAARRRATKLAASAPVSPFRTRACRRVRVKRRPPPP